MMAPSRSIKYDDDNNDDIVGCSTADSVSFNLCVPFAVLKNVVCLSFSNLNM